MFVAAYRSFTKTFDPIFKKTAVLGGHFSWNARIFDMGIDNCSQTSVNYFQNRQNNICSEKCNNYKAEEFEIYYYSGI